LFRVLLINKKREGSLENLDNRFLNKYEKNLKNEKKSFAYLLLLID
jgi:hypothetical protein